MNNIYTSNTATNNNAPLLAKRQYAIGAEHLADGVHFRLWAPKRQRIQLQLINDKDIVSTTEMFNEDNGYFSWQIVDAKPGMRYGFLLDNDAFLYPDPASRFQPDGPHAASQIIDVQFSWTDQHWQGVEPARCVVYEMHIGTFTKAGTYSAAMDELAELAELGITMIEIMPLAEFSGDFGWGYDGVGFFAPYHHYGTPHDLRAFVNRAHNLGIGILLDVVFNHCGASGCYLQQFSAHYFSERYHCEWGDAFNFDGKHSAPVREFFIENARYWTREFHMDGLRLDATQQIFDVSDPHILCEITAAARSVADGRRLLIIAENEPQHARLVRREDGKDFGIDALWNDDFHHAAMVALKGQARAYFSDYRGTPQEFISAVKWGFLFQGQWYLWQKQRRGTPALDLPYACFIHFLQNHDQVANSARGTRIHQMCNPGLYRALAALLLLGPATPMLFQGQEFAASTPFMYFADHHPELAAQVRKGRTEFLHQFPNLATPDIQSYLPRPDDPQTFQQSKLDLSERKTHKEAYLLHKDLLKLRRDDPVFAHMQKGYVDGAVLSAQAFVLRYFSSDGDNDRLLLINMGTDLQLSPMPEPLLAPHAKHDWSVLWSSEHPDYGGQGIVPLSTTHEWRLPGLSALVLKPGNLSPAVTHATI